MCGGGSALVKSPVEERVNINWIRFAMTQDPEDREMLFLDLFPNPELSLLLTRLEVYSISVTLSLFAFFSLSAVTRLEVYSISVTLSLFAFFSFSLPLHDWRYTNSLSLSSSISLLLPDCKCILFLRLFVTLCLLSLLAPSWLKVYYIFLCLFVTLCLLLSPCSLPDFKCILFVNICLFFSLCILPG